MKTTVIDAKKPMRKMQIKELIAYRSVLAMLTLRDMKLRYKQTFLGITWVILQPLLTALLFTVIFGKTLHLFSDEVPYLVFAFCGLIPWLFFSQGLQRGAPSLIHDAKLITKVYFPRMFIPLSATFGVMIDFFITLLLCFLLLFFYHIPLTVNLLFLPLFTLILFLFSASMNLLFSSISVYYRDFKHIVPFLIQFWMYGSPLVYDAQLIPKQFLWIYRLNPMVGLIDGFRFSLLGLEVFPFISFFYCLVTTLFLSFCGILIFHYIEHYFADVI